LGAPGFIRGVLREQIETFAWMRYAARHLQGCSSGGSCESRLKLDLFCAEPRHQFIRGVLREQIETGAGR